MKKYLILIAGVSLIIGTVNAQTQKTNRTKTRTHDRSSVLHDANHPDKNGTDRDEKAVHENDMDRNNTNNSTNPVNPGTINRTNATGTGVNGTTTNGGTGTSGSDIKTNNPR